MSDNTETDADEIFPNAPSFGEIEDIKVEPDEYDDLDKYFNDMRKWYNKAPLAAARVMVRAAREYPEFKSEFMDIGAGGFHRLKKYDQEMHSKVNNMGLSVAQGTHAERIAIQKLNELEDNND